jgi:hypothetical protein
MDNTNIIMGIIDNFNIYLAELMRIHTVAKYSNKNECIIDINTETYNVSKVWMYGQRHVPFGNIGIINNIYWNHKDKYSMVILRQGTNLGRKHTIAVHKRDRYIRYVKNTTNKRIDFISKVIQTTTPIDNEISILFARKYVLQELCDKIVTWEEKIKLYL